MQPELCKTCNGLGWIPQRLRFSTSSTEICPICHGTKIFYPNNSFYLAENNMELRMMLRELICFSESICPYINNVNYEKWKYFTGALHDARKKLEESYPEFIKRYQKEKDKSLFGDLEDLKKAISKLEREYKIK